MTKPKILIVEDEIALQDVLTYNLEREGFEVAVASDGQDGARDPNVQRLEQELAEKLGARVAIQHSTAGKGKLVVTYNSLDELDGILAHIQ